MMGTYFVAMSPMMSGFRVLPLLFLPLLSACTWVHMAPGASAVRVLNAAPAGCDKRGEIAVEVKHNIVFVERNPLKIRDELEVLARNEAPGMEANAVHPLAPPERGKQRFVAWHCGN